MPHWVIYVAIGIVAVAMLGIFALAMFPGTTAPLPPPPPKSKGLLGGLLGGIL